MFLPATRRLYFFRREIDLFFEKHVFVCTNIREEGLRASCGRKNSEEILRLLKENLKKIGSDRKIRIQKSGCLDRCELGPVQVSYPEGKWFSIRTAEDAERFIEEYVRKEDDSKIGGLLLADDRSIGH